MDVFKFAALSLFMYSPNHEIFIIIDLISERGIYGQLQTVRPNIMFLEPNM